MSIFFFVLVPYLAFAVWVVIEVNRLPKMDDEEPIIPPSKTPET